MTNILNLKNKDFFGNKARVEKELTEKSAGKEEVRPARIIEESVTKKTGSENAQENNNSAQNNSPLLEWSAPEFIKYHKGPEWFMIGGLIAFGLLLVALFTKNFIFALIIILAAFSIFIWTQKEPAKINLAVTPRGILINKKNFLRFENLKSFWIFNEPPETKYISIESEKIFVPRIAIPLGEQDPEEIRQILSKFLPEKEYEESLIDTLGKHLRY
ncbi:MAG: hypothetical protein HY813_02290 [Candidatus Portnoybacteria bacterium]|nr:hypothetical protein [Candidatus Portnoybacteria bacterium]